MLPNRAISSSNSPIDNFLNVSAVSRANATAMQQLANKQQQQTSGANSSRSGGGGTGGGGGGGTLPIGQSSAHHHHQQQQASGWGTGTKTLADYVKESGWPGSVAANASDSANHNANAATVSTTSMPWAAAVKSPPEQHAIAANSANNFDYNNTIGSWSSPETSSSHRGNGGGWNADGSSKGGDGALDDGTAIWGNPTTKKTGVDWTEKETSFNPPQSSSSSSTSSSLTTAAAVAAAAVAASHQASVGSLEKRIQKPEPTISSLNGTEAWGAPLRGPNTLNSQQQQSKNDTSGNTYGTNKSATNESSSLSWGEPSSLQQATNENSSPPNSSVWNNLGINNKQKSSDWLSSSSSSGGGGGASGINSVPINTSTAGSRLDELNKQLESTNFFDSISSSSSSSRTKNTSSNNPNLEQHSIGYGGSGGINDLKQMSASYINDLLDSPNRQPSGSSSSSTGNNQQQSQQGLDSAAYSSVAAPSRDLLKQMVHQIQLAVQAGHLNAHILNQPMSTPTLQLVYQLLQQIKTLHQLQEIQQRAGVKSDMSSPSNMDIHINRTRQNISLLQKAITQQQAAMTKNETLAESNLKQQQQQQQQQQHQQQQQQQASNYSYATISKLSTNLKVPSNNMSNIIGNSNIDSFRRSSLIDTISNSNSDPLRSAQATFDANATIDKTLSSLILASSSANNVLGSNKTITTSSDFSKAQGFTSGNIINNQQSSSKRLLPAQSSSSSSSAWSAFSSNDFVSQQGWPSQLRISSNVSQHDHQQQQQQQQQQHQFSAFDMVPEFGPGKAWRGSSILSDAKDNSNMVSGSGNINIVRPNSASNNLKQMNENDILNSRDPSLFCDWSNNSGVGDSNNKRREFDQISGNSSSSFSSSAIGSLSLQSNPWMFAPNSSSLNINSGIDNKTNISGGNSNISNKLDNGNVDKMAGDSLFIKSNTAGNMQRSSSALYDWGELASTTLQFGADANQQLNKQQQPSSSVVVGAGVSGSGGRPAPPPGLLSNFGPIIGSSASANGISLLDSKLRGSSDEAQLQSRDSASSLWSGNWFN